MKTVRSVWLIAAILASIWMMASYVEAEDQMKEASNLTFSLDLYSKLRTSSGNIVVSPYSIEQALALTASGASGETLSQMLRTLHYPAEGNGQAKESLLRIEALAKKGDVIVNVANALWLESEYHFLDTFVEIAKERFHAELHVGDFINSAEKVRVEINQWVEERTEGKIKDLISPGALTAVTRLVIVNAVYLKALWETEFKKDSTYDQDFWISKSEKFLTPTMHQRAHFDYAESDKAQLLSLPYKGGELSMLIFLPKTRDGLSKFEEALEPALVNDLISKLESKEVAVALPKFKIKLNVSLGTLLSNMGMGLAFDPDRADFSKMDGTRKLFISEVIHQAFIETDEKGTEAAAATAVIMLAGSAYHPSKPIEFTADHPFLFAIREKNSGSILFLGRIADPR